MPGMILHTLDLLMRHNTSVHSLPMMLPPKSYRFFFEGGKNMRKRDQLRVSRALERLGTVQISKRCLTAFFKYLCETQLHMTQKWYTHCAGIISNWNSARLFSAERRAGAQSCH